jgi:hypothetical protein
MAPNATCHLPDKSRSCTLPLPLPTPARYCLWVSSILTVPYAFEMWKLTGLPPKKPKYCNTTLHYYHLASSRNTSPFSNEETTLADTQDNTTEASNSLVDDIANNPFLEPEIEVRAAKKRYQNSVSTALAALHHCD